MLCQWWARRQTSPHSFISLCFFPRSLRPLAPAPPRVLTTFPLCLPPLIDGSENEGCGQFFVFREGSSLSAAARPMPITLLHLLLNLISSFLLQDVSTALFYPFFYCSSRPMLSTSLGFLESVRVFPFFQGPPLMVCFGGQFFFQRPRIVTHFITYECPSTFFPFPAFPEFLWPESVFSCVQFHFVQKSSSARTACVDPPPYSILSFSFLLAFF